MNSIQESTNELNAAIRYAENAITSAKQTIESMQFRQDMAMKQYTEQTGREQALEEENAKLREHKERLTGLEIQLRDKNQGLYDDKAMLEREVADLKEQLKMETAAVERLRKDTPTMPVIPKDVAIAIFREGVSCGVDYACDEIENSDSIVIEDTGYTGGFEVSFSKYVDLTEHIDTDWMRSKVGDYEESNAIATLRGLCKTKGFECRIHGVDDNPTNND